LLNVLGPPDTSRRKLLYLAVNTRIPTLPANIEKKEYKIKAKTINDNLYSPSHGSKKI